MTQVYELTDAQYQQILEASRPVPYLIAGGHEPTSPFARIENAWRDVAREHGCVWWTIEPSSKGDRFFQATPSAPRDGER